MSNLPPLYACEYCGIQVDPNANGVWHRVTGWVQNKRSGHSGSIALASPVGGLCCNICMDMIKRGISPAQEKLF